jgi:hypothetical protein
VVAESSTARDSEGKGTGGEGEVGVDGRGEVGVDAVNTGVVDQAVAGGARAGELRLVDLQEVVGDGIKEPGGVAIPGGLGAIRADGTLSDFWEVEVAEEEGRGRGKLNGVGSLGEDLFFEGRRPVRDNMDAADDEGAEGRGDGEGGGVARRDDFKREGEGGGDRAGNAEEDSALGGGGGEGEGEKVGAAEFVGP